VDNVMMDDQFENLQSNLSSSGIRLNVSTIDEHVSKIERYVETVKQRIRGIYNTLPFKVLTQRMIFDMAKNASITGNS
jgi:hypothetical protein